LVAPDIEQFSANGVEFRRDKGELLRPGCYTEKQLERLQSQTEPVDFETLYQQNAGGRPFAKLDSSCFGTHASGIYSRLPLVVSVDPARSPLSNSSFSVVQAWVPFANKHILVAQFRGRPSFEELGAELLSFCKKYLPSIILIENNSNAAGLAQKLGRSKFNIKLVPVENRSKLERLQPHIPLIRNGGIEISARVNREEFIAEVVEFPSGKFSDQVDALTQYLDYATTHIVPPRRERAVMNRLRQYPRSSW
jgi:phage terminase large subunit-like protein